jgi:hypothetical protein
MRSEEELRGICASVLAGTAETEDEETLAAEPELAAEVDRRLAACGLRLIRARGQAPFAVVEAAGEALSELSLACLALACVALRDKQNGKRPRLLVHEIWERIGKKAGYSEAYLRRAGIGPLEQRGFVHVVKPEQRAADAYLVAGPAFTALDLDGVQARLRRLEGVA